VAADRSPSKSPPTSASGGSAAKAAAPPDPFSPENRKQLALRLGLPLLAGWIIAIAIPGWVPKVLAAIITGVALGLVAWAVRYAKKAKAVASIVQAAPQTKEGRKEALEKLEAQFKKDDVAATFAKAQLQMQEDPRAALKTLEAIDLKKVMAPVADEARAQRAMIHLVLGETDDAKVLVEPIDLSRHKEPRTRATLTAIVAESWSRAGQAKRAVELLDKIDDKDAAYAEIQPQLLRARAFAHAGRTTRSRCGPPCAASPR
jgi:methionine-rich copper-binding protein CopC